MAAEVSVRYDGIGCQISSFFFLVISVFIFHQKF